MKVDFNKEIELLKKGQVRRKLKMKYSARQTKCSPAKLIRLKTWKKEFVVLKTKWNK